MLLSRVVNGSSLSEARRKGKREITGRYVLQTEGPLLGEHLIWVHWGSRASEMGWTLDASLCNYLYYECFLWSLCLGFRPFTEFVLYMWINTSVFSQVVSLSTCKSLCLHGNAVDLLLSETLDKENELSSKG